MYSNKSKQKWVGSYKKHNININGEASIKFLTFLKISNSVWFCQDKYVNIIVKYFSIVNLIKIETIIGENCFIIVAI